MFTLVIPALLRSEQEFIPALHTPALNEFLRFGRITRQAQSTSELYLNHLAPSFSLHENEVLASPIWQKMGLHSMSILDGHAIEIQTHEAQQLCDDLNSFYQQELMFSVLRPDLWKLRFSAAPQWHAPDIWQVCGQIDGSVQASGVERTQWLQYSTELQMWLHTHAINQTRKSQGLPEINGIWLWRPPAVSHTPATLIGSDSPWSSGLGLPSHWQDWRHTCSQHATPLNQTLLFLDALLISKQTDDIWHYQETLHHWEQAFFAPILKDIRSGQLDGVRLICEAGQCILSRRHFWSFWKTKRLFNGQSI